MIHGDKSQTQREAVVQDFREGYLKVVVATDVASRGLGTVLIPEHVIFSISRCQRY